MAVLRTNFPFLSVDECDMLLDLFGALLASCIESRSRSAHTHTAFTSCSVHVRVVDTTGSIAKLSRASADDILDTTVLSAASAHAITEFFSSEYVVE